MARDKELNDYSRKMLKDAKRDYDLAPNPKVKERHKGVLQELFAAIFRYRIACSKGKLIEPGNYRKKSKV